MKNLLRNFRWRRLADKYGPRKLQVLELSPNSSKGVVLSRKGHRIICEATRDLPSFSPNQDPTGQLREHILPALDTQTYYISVVITGSNVMVRLLTFPVTKEDKSASVEEQVKETFGVDNSYEVRCKILEERTNKDKQTERVVLAAALPSDLVQQLNSAFSTFGFEPVSLLPAGVAVSNLAAYENTVNGVRTGGFLVVDANTSTLLLFCNDNPVLARQFNVGVENIIASLQDSFQLDHKTASKLFASGSFDFSDDIGKTISSWLHQIGISLDFVERRFSQQIGTLRVFEHANGHGSNVLAGLLSTTLKREIAEWHPFQNWESLEFANSVETPAAYALPLTEGVRIIDTALHSANA